MGMNYYYLAASLPTLVPNEEPGMTVEGFLSVSRRYVGDRDFERITQARIEDHDSQPSSDVLAAWQEFDLNLREQLLALRAPTLGRSGEEFTRCEYPVFVNDQVRNVFDESDPLRAERRLFFMRWMYLDEIDRSFFMRLENLIIYVLKLQLINQWNAMSDERGNQVLKLIRSGFGDQLPTWDEA